MTVGCLVESVSECLPNVSNGTPRRKEFLDTGHQHKGIGMDYKGYGSERFNEKEKS